MCVALVRGDTLSAVSLLTAAANPRDPDGGDGRAPRRL